MTTSEPLGTLWTGRPAAGPAGVRVACVVAGTLLAGILLTTGAAMAERPAPVARDRNGGDGESALPSVPPEAGKGDDVSDQTDPRFFEGLSTVRALRSENADDPEAIKVTMELDHSGLKGHVGMAWRAYDRIIEELPKYGIAVDLSAPVGLTVRLSHLEKYQYWREYNMDYIIRIEILKNGMVGGHGGLTVTASF